MLSYQNTVNQVPTERSQAHNDAQNVAAIEALLEERYSLLPSSFPKTLFFPNLLSNSDRFPKCDEIRQRSGECYAPNVLQSDEHPAIKSEEFVDLDRLLLYVNSDEQAAANSASKKAINADDFDFDNNNTNSDNNNFENAPRAADSTNNPFIFNLKDSNGGSNNNSNNNHHHHLNKDYISDKFVGSGSNSPVNVLSMEGSPSNEYFLVNGAMDVSSQHALDGNFFESLDSLIPTEDSLPIYTPDNSNGGPFTDFPDYKQHISATSTTTNNTRNLHHHPMLTLNLKDSFVNLEEINTPNIIDTIIEASEHPVQFIRDKGEIFNQPPPFFVPPLEDLTPCPSASPPATISDTTDSFLTTITNSPQPRAIAKKRGRPRKRRHVSDDDDEDDETYVPPPSNYVRRIPTRTPRAIAKKEILYENISDGDELEEEDEDVKPPHEFILDVVDGPSTLEGQSRLSPLYEDENVRAGRRGRPPKHVRSISSDDYSLLDPEEAKYREMRDRNNEASRKSRYKRKRKECVLSVECEYLETENVKLKAQVEELQKTVERYRDSMMQVMLSKK